LIEENAECGKEVKNGICCERLLISASERRIQMQARILFFIAVLAIASLPLAGCGDDSAPTFFFTQANLVSNIPGVAVTTDPNLVNSWGIVHTPTSPWWVNDNGTGVATVYDGQGKPAPAGAPLTVTIPPLPGSPAGTTAAPTGIVFNNTTSFNVAAGQPARFIFVTEDGTVSAWNPNVNATNAVLMANYSSAAVYKGAALAANGAANFLYVANFRGASVDVFDRTFTKVAQPAGAFTDPTVPAGYAPFNIANMNGNLFVTYAMQNAAKHDDVAGDGHGFVDVYSPSGSLLMRLQNGLWFNSPWGMAMAPAGFGTFSNMLLVGNFGSGEIAAFDPVTGKFMGLMRDAFSDPIVISGLWGLGFGNGGSAGPITTLFFAAGLNGESDGLFGTLNAVAR
jgi:uncharacterized protein (TIGR03118 family)